MIRTKNYCLILCLILIISCQQEKEDKHFVARVDNEYLTANEVDSSLSSNKFNSKFREEFIREWIEKEVLFQEAKRIGITDDHLFKAILNHSEKELASALLLQKVIDDSDHNIKNQELVKYYQNNKDEFKLTDKAFVFNRIIFNNKDKAILFRSALIDSDWQKALNVYALDNSVVNYQTEKLFYYHEVFPQLLLRYLNNLEPLETSIVFETEPMHFSVVQVKKKYNENDVPDYEQIKNKVKETYLLHMRKNILNDYINDLISKYNVEIIR